MPVPVVPGRARTAWVTCVLTLAVGVVALRVPEMREMISVGSALVALIVVGVAVVWHRPPNRIWWAFVLMLTLWAIAHVSAQVLGTATGTPGMFVGAGQLVAAAVVVRLIWIGKRHRAPGGGGGVDVVIIAAVLALVAAQLVAAVAIGGGTSSVLLVPTLDVAIIGMLLRMAVTGRGLPTSTYVLLAAAGTSLLYDLINAVHGQRISLPGQPTQALGAVCVMLFAVAALHPTMVAAFDPRTLTRRRPPSAALLGLLPLVVVPLALWGAARTTSAPGLPTWALLVASSLVAGLCLVRAAVALRGSEHLAEHDPLTGVANRRSLERAFTDRPPTGGRSMVLIDIDEFKQINDTYGHDVGDALLLAVRDRLVVPREGVELVARLGGDEFVMMVATPRARSVAEQVLASLRTPVTIGDLELRVSASIGVADATADLSLSVLITHADVAMYGAKASGRDGVATFNPGMREEVAHRFVLTSQVRQLLGPRSPDVGRLEIHYQPVVDLLTGAHVAAEALVRWRHPQHGLLCPDAFLGLVSTSGLDERLDQEVLSAVIDQVRQWQRDELHAPPISVNLTTDSLANPLLAEQVLGRVSPKIGVGSGDAGWVSRRQVLSDAQWDQIAPLLPSSDGRRGRRFRDHRQVVEGIVYRYRTGVAWRDLPVEFGPWQTVWKRHKRFSSDGTWDNVLTRLLAHADAAGQIDWAVSIDSTINRTHQHAATLPRTTGGIGE